MNLPPAGCPASHADGRVRRLDPGTAAPPPPPGPRGRRLRNLVRRLTDYPAFLAELHRRYGDVVLFSMPARSCCVVYDIELIRAIFEDDGRFFGPGPLYSATIPQVPTPALGSSFGEGHRWRAALFSRAFTPACIRDYAAIMVEHVRTRLDAWRAGQVIDVGGEMMRFTAGVVAAAGVGRAMNPDADVVLGLRAALKWDWIAGHTPFPDIARRLPLPGFVRARRAFARFDDMVYGAIARARGRPAPENTIVSQAAHSRGPAGGERPFTDKELRDEFTIFVLNAIGPPAQALTWAIDYLAWNPAARDRLEAEAAGGGPIAVDDFDRTPYARAVFSETVRLAPTAYVADRAAVGDCVLGGYRVPAGTIVHPCMGLLHRNAELFERPLAFRPERWLEEPLREPARRAYMPFGVGPKTCIGDAFATRLCVYLLAALARSWRLEPVSKRPARPKFGPLGPYVVKDRLRMVVRRRA